jgi:hypothetical protein
MKTVSDPVSFSPAARGPKLVCQGITGHVYTGYAKTFYLEVRNDGDEAINIHEVRTSCRCTVSNHKEDVILPGKTILLPVKYTANKLSGSFEQPVVLFSNDPDSPQKLTSIRGNIIPPEFVSSKREIHLRSFIGFSNIPVEEVVFSSPKKILFLGAEADPNIFILDLAQLNENSFSVKISAKIQHKCAVIADMLKVHFLLDDKIEDSVEMPLEYTISPPYMTYPSEITIMNFDQEIYTRLLLKAVNGYNIKIRNIKTSGIDGMSTNVKKLNDQQYYIYLQGKPRKYIDHDKTGLTIELDGSTSIFVPIKRDDLYKTPL